MLNDILEEVCATDKDLEEDLHMKCSDKPKAKNKKIVAFENKFVKAF